MYHLLRQHNAARCPFNDFTDGQIQPLEFCLRVPSIYGRRDEDSHLERIWFAGNITERYEEEELERCFVLVSPRTISRELNLLLLERVDQVIGDVCGNESLPDDFRQACIELRDRDTDKLGPKKVFYFHLIVMGFKVEYDLSVKADTFDNEEEEEAERLSEAKATSEYCRSKDGASNSESLEPNKRSNANSVCQMAANLLSYTTEDTLDDDLDKVEVFFRTFGEDNSTPDAVGKRWDSFLNRYLLPGILQPRCRQYVKKNFKANKGNRKPRKKTDRRTNNETYESLLDGKEFLIMSDQPADEDSLEASFDPKDFSHWKLFKKHRYVDHSTFVYEGLRTRLRKENKKRNIKHSLRMVGRVYCCLNEEDSQPVFIRARSSYKPPKGWPLVFYVCCLQ